MRVVVMDQDWREPLTVVDIPTTLMREVESGERSRRVRLAVPVSFGEWFAKKDEFANAIQQFDHMKICDLQLEPVYRGREVRYWVAIPDDEVLALVLRAAFLPGQLTELRRREAVQWFMGSIGAPPPAGR